MEFIFDLKKLNYFDKAVLQKLKTTAFPLAVKGTLNTAAFRIRKDYQQDIIRSYILRNKFTEKSVRVEPVRTLKITEMVARVGSIAPYMSAQESGETRRSKGRYGLRIPTPAAGDQKSRRTVPIKKKYRRGQLKISNKKGVIRAENKKQFILMSIRVAALRGQSPYVFLPFRGKKSGIYKIIPTGPSPSLSYRRGKKRFRRKFKWGRPKGTPGKEKLLMIHSFAYKTIVIPATSKLKKNAEITANNFQIIFNREADRQFKRFLR